MKYSNVTEGIFIDRPNRFIAHVQIGGKTEVCHVKNTGRCKELLVEGARVILQKSDNIKRKTAYDLVSVYKNERLINIDSYAPNMAFFEYLKSPHAALGNIKPKDIIRIKPESKFGNSRFDFYMQTKKGEIYIEVKGVTLEKDNITMFPDAPTERGTKHALELIEGVHSGYKAFLVFVIQMKGVKYFTPYKEMDQAFCRA
ncbi:MAG: DNA/RNA nuclease SfsA, partial [Bacillota bacterium]|nr:DNA/RNA nuclease SfsA [Bacillota bacterium]